MGQEGPNPASAKRVAAPGTIDQSDPNASRAFADRLGNCYELTGTYLFGAGPDSVGAHPGSTLVHGTIQGNGQPRLQHAWVENPDGSIFEPATGHRMTADEFKAWASPQVDARYTSAAAIFEMTNSGHFGPWEFKGLDSARLDELTDAHNLPGSPDGAGTVDDPIAVGDDLDLAVSLLAQGKHIRLDRSDEVGTLLDKLVEQVNDAKKRGETAPTYDLCLVSVPGTNLFCRDTKGIPRPQMPQLGGFPRPGSRAFDLERTEEGGVDISAQFIEECRSRGIGLEQRTVPAYFLKATQNQLDGPKVAKISRSMEKHGLMPGTRLFVTRDGYIIDGHHRWAAMVAWDAKNGELGDIEVDVEMLDMEIGEAIDFANAFAADYGILPAQIGANAEKPVEAVPEQRIERITGNLSMGQYLMTTQVDDIAEHVGDPIHLDQLADAIAEEEGIGLPDARIAAMRYFRRRLDTQVLTGQPKGWEKVAGGYLVGDWYVERAAGRQWNVYPRKDFDIDTEMLLSTSEIALEGARSLSEVRDFIQAHGGPDPTENAPVVGLPNSTRGIDDGPLDLDRATTLLLNATIGQDEAGVMGAYLDLGGAHHGEIPPLEDLIAEAERRRRIAEQSPRLNIHIPPTWPDLNPYPGWRSETSAAGTPVYRYAGKNGIATITPKTQNPYLGDRSWTVSWASKEFTGPEVPETKFDPDALTLDIARAEAEAWAGEPAVTDWVPSNHGPVEDPMAHWTASQGWFPYAEDQIRYADGSQIKFNANTGVYDIYPPIEREGMPGTRVTHAKDLKAAQKNVERRAWDNGWVGTKNLPRLKKPAPVKTANPMLVSGDKRYIPNCQKCCAAEEMRARGFDVVASYGSGYWDGTGDHTQFFDWFRHEPEDVHPFTLSLQFEGRYEQVLAEVNDLVGGDPQPGMRGTLDCQLGNPFTGVVESGHIFFWRVEKDRSVRFYDPQNGSEYGPKHDIWVRIAPFPGSSNLFRTDDKEFVGPVHGLFEDASTIDPEYKKRYAEVVALTGEVEDLQVKLTEMIQENNSQVERLVEMLHDYRASLTRDDLERMLSEGHDFMTSEPDDPEYLDLKEKNALLSAQIQEGQRQLAAYGPRFAELGVDLEDNPEAEQAAEFSPNLQPGVLSQGSFTGTEAEARATAADPGLSFEERRDAGWALLDAGLITQDELDDMLYPRRGPLPTMRGEPIPSNPAAVRAAEMFIAQFEEAFAPGTPTSNTGVTPPNLLTSRKRLEVQARLGGFIDELGGGALTDWYELALRVRAGGQPQPPFPATGPDVGYRGQYQPPDPEYGAPMNAPDSMMPDLLAHPEWYSTGYDDVDRESMAAIYHASSGPETKVWVYRAVPAGVTEINPGDWVTPSRTYAQIHAEGNLGQVMDPDTGEMVPVPSTILRKRVKAGDLYFDGNSMAEWGWQPDARRERLTTPARGPFPATGPPPPPITVGRTNIPEIDALVDQFLDQPVGDWTTDDSTIREYAAIPENTHGACQEVAEQFVEFAKAQGFNAFTTDVYLDEIGYTPQGPPHGEVLDDDGNVVPGFYPEHTIASVYLPGRAFPVGIDFTATQYGYREVPKITDGDVTPFTGPLTSQPQTRVLRLAFGGNTANDLADVLRAEQTRDPSIVADNYDLDSVTQTEVDAAAEEIRQQTQAALQANGTPDTVTLYRAGDLSPDDPFPSFSWTPQRQFGDPQPYTVRREDIWADTTAINPGLSLDESEVLVRPGSAQPATAVSNIARWEGAPEGLTRHDHVFVVDQLWDQVNGDEFERSAQPWLHPERYIDRRVHNTNPKAWPGPLLRQGEIETRLDQTPGQTPTLYDVTPMAPGPIDWAEAEPGSLGGGDGGPGNLDVPLRRVPGSERPLPAVFRIMDEREYQQALQRGYIQSDQRMNLSDEGTVTSTRSTGVFYAPWHAGTQGADPQARIVRIRMDPADGWQTDTDGYVKTHQQIPIDRIEQATEPFTKPEANTPALLPATGTTATLAYPPITRADLSNPDTPRTRGVTAEEFEQIAARGQTLLEGYQTDTAAPTGLDDNWDTHVEAAWQAVQEPWGGATIDAHTGENITDHGYAITVKPAGMDSVTIPIGASRAEFARAMQEARIKFNDLMLRKYHCLGVFRDQDSGTIDIDPVLVVDDPADAEAIGAFTRNIGGAYSFADGNGYWPPYIQEETNVGLAAAAGLPGSGSVVRRPEARGSPEGGAGAAEVSAARAAARAAAARTMTF